MIKKIKSLVPNRYKVNIMECYRKVIPETPDPYPSYMLYGKKEYMDYTQVLAFNHVEQYKRFIIYGTTKKTNELMESIKKISSNGEVVCCLDPRKMQIGRKKLLRILKTKQADCLIIALPLNFTDIRYELVGLKGLPKVIDLYDIARFVPEFYHPEIEKYKDIHKGKRCFVIGNGPSLKAKDLDVLHEHKEICFASNGIYDIYKDTKWREDYYTVVDSGAFPLVKKHLEVAYNRAFIKDVYNYDGDVEKNDTIKVNYVHMLQGQAYHNHPPFSFDVSRCVFDGSSCIYFSIQLAAYMGFNKIYLLGVDNTICKLEEFHFTKNYLNIKQDIPKRGGLKEIVYKDNRKYEADTTADGINRTVQSAEKYLKSIGVEVYNATRGGELEILERVEFDSLF